MRDVITVTEINRYIKEIFAENPIFYNILIKGEISNCKNSHGNYYFSLKDEYSTIQAIMFNNDVIKEINSVKLLKDGIEVIVTGRIAVYDKNGTYAIYVQKIESVGLGDYYIKLEELKKKLFDMGMFDDIYKKKIPKYAMNIGVVTAKNGAAIRDIIKTIKNKNKYANIVLYPALVQGDNAYKSIINGIIKLDKMNLDVIIIGRGGGSIEDLYCFNDERVAYAIFNANTPIISAVGHEINSSISDLVADLSVATPTAAGEVATFSYDEFENDIYNYKMTFENIINSKILDIKDKLEEKKVHIDLLAPKSKISLYKNKIKFSKNKINIDIKNYIKVYKHKIEKYIEKLKLRDALERIERGYSITLTSTDIKINSIKDIKVNEKIKTRIKDGIIDSLVTNVRKV